MPELVQGLSLPCAHPTVWISPDEALHTTLTGFCVGSYLSSKDSNYPSATNEMQETR